MKQIFLAVFLVFSSNVYSQDTTPDDLRNMIVESMVIDLQILIDGQNPQATSLTKKIKALIESYESSLEAHRNVMFALKNKLDENNIKMRID